jgi:hypothetical protein
MISKRLVLVLLIAYNMTTQNIGEFDENSIISSRQTMWNEKEHKQGIPYDIPSILILFTSGVAMPRRRQFHSSKRIIIAGAKDKDHKALLSSAAGVSPGYAKGKFPKPPLTQTED